MKLKGSTWFGLALLVFTLVLLAMSFDYNPRARFIPELLAGALVALLVPLLLQETVPGLRRPLGFVQRQGLSLGQPDEPASQEHPHKRNENRRLLRLLAWFVGFTAALGLVSYLVVVPLFLFLFVLLEGKQKWWAALAVAGVMGVFDYLLFALFLNATF